MKKQVLNPYIGAGSGESNEPRHRGSIATEMLHGFICNTDLCVDVRTILRKDRFAKPGKEYPGVLNHDQEDHYTFVETIPPTTCKRNPHVFEGRYITVTRRDDGSLWPNFKRLERGENFSVEKYALGVFNELCIALGGLVEEE